MGQWRHLFNSAPSLSIESSWPEELEIRVAENEAEFERAFRLLHEVYVEENLMERQASGMRILPQQLLPQSSLIIALWKGKIIGAASLIRDNPLGLPMEQALSLAKHRHGGRCLAELSLIAIDPMEHALATRIKYPLFRFIFHYARKCFGIQSLTLRASPKTIKFYQNVLLFHRLGIRSMGLILDLEEAQSEWQQAYSKRTEDSNLARYMENDADHPGCRFPTRIYSVASDLRLTPQMLEQLFLKKAGLLNTLKKNEVRVIQHAYPHENFEFAPQHWNWCPDGTLLREIRLDTQMTAQIVDEDRRLSPKMQVRNISRHGMQIWSECSPNLNDVFTLEVKLNGNQYTRVCAQVKWIDPSGFCGLRILSYSSEWSIMLQSIEGQLEKLAAAK
jgi:hypothetical protein